MLVPDPQVSPLSRLSRPLPRGVQLAVLAAVALVVTVVLFFAVVIRAHFGALPAVAAAPAAPGTFRPSDAQWASFKLAPVVRTTLRVEQIADGKIATDDDLRRRSSRLIPGASSSCSPGSATPSSAARRCWRRGERVRPGAERPDHRARHAADTARSQLALAQTNETSPARALSARKAAHSKIGSRRRPI